MTTKNENDNVEIDNLAKELHKIENIPGIKAEYQTLLGLAEKLKKNGFRYIPEVSNQVKVKGRKKKDSNVKHTEL